MEWPSTPAGNRISQIHTIAGCGGSSSDGHHYDHRGNGIQGYGGDGGPAINAELWSPWAVTLDTSGNLYFADANNNRVRLVNAATGIITTYAGDGTEGFSGDGGPAVDAALSEPAGLR